MNELSAVLSGFSAVTCFILCIVYLFSLPEMQKTIVGKITCLALMFTLALVQLAHVHYFFSGDDLLGSRYYLLLLSLVPVTFYFFFRELLFHGSRPGVRDAVHLLPLLFCIGVAKLLGSGCHFHCRLWLYPAPIGERLDTTPTCPLVETAQGEFL